MLETIYKHITLQEMLWMLLAVPIFSSLMSLCLMKLNKILSNSIIALGGALTAGITVILFFTLSSFEKFDAALITGPLFRWAVSKNLIIEAGLAIDELSLLMIMIASIGFSILYLNYLRSNNPFFPLAQFFLFLSILGDNLMLSAVAWMGMTISIYFAMNLKRKSHEIGYMFVNLLADFLLLIFIFLIFAAMSAHGMVGIEELLNFKAIERTLPYLVSISKILTALLCAAIFLKSVSFIFLSKSEKEKINPAVFALITCLGPTFCALYMAFRLSFILALLPQTLNFLILAGLIVSAAASISSLRENSMFHCLKYIAISQIGIILFAVGRGVFLDAALIFVSFTICMFLLNIAFSNASIASGGIDEMSKLGGMGRRLPVSKWAAIIAAFAIAGIIPTSGFFASESALWNIYQSGKIFYWILMIILLFFSALALQRMAGLTFFGDSHLTKEQWLAATEPGAIQIISLLLLISAIFGLSFISLPTAFGGHSYLLSWIANAMTNSAIPISSSSMRYLLAVIVEVLMINSLVLGGVLFSKQRKRTFAYPDDSSIAKKICSILEKIHHISIDVFMERWTLNNLFSTPRAFFDSVAAMTVYFYDANKRYYIYMFGATAIIIFAALIY